MEIIFKGKEIMFFFESEVLVCYLFLFVEKLVLFFGYVCDDFV